MYIWRVQLLFWQFSQQSKKKIETKNILINEKNFKDLIVYFTRYVHSKLIKMLSLHYHELIGKIEEQEGNSLKSLTVDYYMPDKVLDNNT